MAILFNMSESCFSLQSKIHFGNTISIYGIGIVPEFLMGTPPYPENRILVYISCSQFQKKLEKSIYVDKSQDFHSDE